MSAEGSSDVPPAAACIGAASCPVAWVWMEEAPIADEPDASMCNTLAPPRTARMEQRMRRRAAAQRAALPRLFAQLLSRCADTDRTGSDSDPTLARPSTHALTLIHSRLGAPRLPWEGPAAEEARRAGLRPEETHVSFTHDGGRMLAVAASAPRLRGIGVDLVHLERLDRAQDHGRLLRFARQFMSPEELDGFLRACAGETEEGVRVRVAAHFSLMEAASKALGTGLRLGGGFGRPGSVSKRHLGVASLHPMEFLLGPEAAARCQALGAKRAEGHWSHDGVFLSSLVLLWGDAPAETPLSAPP